MSILVNYANKNQPGQDECYNEIRKYIAYMKKNYIDFIYKLLGQRVRLSRTEVEIRSFSSNYKQDKETYDSPNDTFTKKASELIDFFSSYKDASAKYHYEKGEMFIVSHELTIVEPTSLQIIYWFQKQLACIHEILSLLESKNEEFNKLHQLFMNVKNEIESFKDKILDLTFCQSDMSEVSELIEELKEEYNKLEVVLEIEKLAESQVVEPFNEFMNRLKQCITHDYSKYKIDGVMLLYNLAMYMNATFELGRVYYRGLDEVSRILRRRLGFEFK